MYRSTVLSYSNIHTHGVVKVVEEQQDEADEGQECQDGEQCHDKHFGPAFFLLSLVLSCHSIRLSFPHQ